MATVDEKEQVTTDQIMALLRGGAAVPADVNVRFATLRSGTSRSGRCRLRRGGGAGLGLTATGPC